MQIARVVGTVVSTEKEPALKGLRLYLLDPLGVDGAPTGEHLVAVDAVGAGAGEVVLFATGSSARQTPLTDRKPVDAVVMAIVDAWEVEGEVRYRKSEDEAA
ncbi:MAG: EutN/CcmL family microcompartment protein [bacterium]